MKRTRVGVPRLEYEDVEVGLDDRVLDTLHRDLQQIRVGCVGEVHVYLSPFGTVEPSEFVGKVLRCRTVVIVGSCVIGEVIFDRLARQLLLEEIDLVEKEDDRRLLEPRETHDRLEQQECFLHLVLVGRDAR